MTIETLRAALSAALQIPVIIAGTRGGLIKDDHIIVTETGLNVYKANEISAERVTEYAVDLYTAGMGEALRDALIDEFDALGVPWRVNTSFMESGTNLWHREFILEA